MSNTQNSKTENTKTDHLTYENFAKKVLAYLSLYSGGVGVFILASGYLNAFGIEIFPVSVLLALIGSTTLMAIALVGLTFYGLSRKQ